MIKRRIKNEALDNVHKVVDEQSPEVVAQVDIVTAEAIQADKAASAHVDDVNNELNKAAETVAPEKTEEPKTDVKNDFTAKLVLDESMQDFQLHEAPKLREDGRANKVTDDDGMNTYLDYDMFDFVYGLVTDCYPVPKNPISSPKKRKFMYIGSDNYANRPENSDDIDAFDLHAQVSSDGDTITIYAQEDRKTEHGKTVKLGTVSAFDWIRAVCDLYKLKYTGPNPRKSANSHWEYSLTISVPCESGYPMMVEDYFEGLGLTMEDVMDAEFCKGYRKAQEKERKEAQEYINGIEVEKKLKAAITAAAQDNSLPLETHLKRLYAELTAAGLKYSKNKIKKEFMDAFDDGDEEDED